MRVNVTSAYTVEVLKDQRQNRKLLVNYEETTLSQIQRRQIMCEKKLRDPQRHRMIIYTNVNVETSPSIQQRKSSGQEQMSSEHSRKLTPQLLRDAPPLNCPATLADEEEKNNRHRDSHNVNEKINQMSKSETFHPIATIIAYRKSSKINIKKPYWRGGAIYYLRYISAMEYYRSNKQAEESKARKQAKQPDAIINEIDQLTDSEANCPECKNATHASEYMEVENILRP
ncbi:hypothetical protein RhiirA4_440524 [Rhizophagus irregularis]|uniref:Uncharacterized protein n=1 Tax=Rhizophagus irregularis TaxID=588596 RepID=A0A2I1G0J8_9GLOM|nr:hypothetical protein RhiirA4_440524 [Rhizophagus irregularis]